MDYVSYSKSGKINPNCSQKKIGNMVGYVCNEYQSYNFATKVGGVIVSMSSGITDYRSELESLISSIRLKYWLGVPGKEVDFDLALTNPQTMEDISERSD